MHKVAKLNVYVHVLLLGQKVGVVIITAPVMNLGKNYWLQSLSRVKNVRVDTHHAQVLNNYGDKVAKIICFRTRVRSKSGRGHHNGSGDEVRQKQLVAIDFSCQKNVRVDTYHAQILDNYGDVIDHALFYFLA